MEPEHTRGPWKVVEQQIPHYLGGCHVARTIYTEWHHPQMQGPLPVVCVSVGIPENKGDKAVQFCHIGAANADVIAASPELLDACQLAEAFISGAEPRLARDRKETINEILPALRAAIAKARGMSSNA